MSPYAQKCTLYFYSGPGNRRFMHEITKNLLTTPQGML